MKAKLVIKQGTISGDYFAIQLIEPKCPNSSGRAFLRLTEFHYSQYEDPEALLSEIVRKINKGD